MSASCSTCCAVAKDAASTGVLAAAASVASAGASAGGTACARAAAELAEAETGVARTAPNSAWPKSALGLVGDDRGDVDRTSADDDDACCTCNAVLLLLLLLPRPLAGDAAYSVMSLAFRGVSCCLLRGEDMGLAPAVDTGRVDLLASATCNQRWEENKPI